jgi:folylpolyglutamate synthase/dihydropteroate synthase
LLGQWLSAAKATLPTKSGSIDQMLGDAVERALSLSLPVVVAGSLYLVGDVRKRLTGLVPEFPIGEHSPEDNRQS